MKILAERWHEEDLCECWESNGAALITFQTALPGSDHRSTKTCRLGLSLIEVPSLSPKWTYDFIIDTQVERPSVILTEHEILVGAGNRLIRLERETGKSHGVHELPAKISGPMLPSDQRVWFSTEDCVLREYDHDSRTCEPVTNLRAPLWNTVLLNNRIYTITSGGKSKAPRQGKKSYTVERIDPNSGLIELFAELGSDFSFYCLGQYEEGLLVGAGGVFRFLSEDGSERWRHRMNDFDELGPDFPIIHGQYGNLVLVSTGDRCHLIGLHDGNTAHQVRLDRKLASAHLVGLDGILFSTCGGGWSNIMFGNDPQNYVGMHKLSDGTTQTLFSVPETSRIGLSSLGSTHLARAGLINVSGGRTYRSRLTLFSLT